MKITPTHPDLKLLSPFNQSICHVKANIFFRFVSFLGLAGHDASTMDCHTSNPVCLLAWSHPKLLELFRPHQGHVHPSHLPIHPYHLPGIITPSFPSRHSVPIPIAKNLSLFLVYPTSYTPSLLAPLPLLQTKGTYSFGRRNRKSHTLCVRCGKHAYNIQKSRCASCAFPAAKMRRCESSQPDCQPSHHLSL